MGISKEPLRIQHVLAMSMLHSAIRQVASLCDLDIVTLLAVMGQQAGELACCYDKSVEEQEGEPSKDGIETLKMNIDFAFEEHAEVHARKRDKAEKCAHQFVKDVCESHKKGE